MRTRTSAPLEISRLFTVISVYPVNGRSHPSFRCPLVGTGTPASCTETAFNTAVATVQASGGDATRLFRVQSHSLTLRNIILTDGFATQYGGAIYAHAATAVTLTGSTITDRTSGVIGWLTPPVMAEVELFLPLIAR